MKSAFSFKSTGSAPLPHITITLTEYLTLKGEICNLKTFLKAICIVHPDISKERLKELFDEFVGK